MKYKTTKKAVMNGYYKVICGIILQFAALVTL